MHWQRLYTHLEKCFDTPVLVVDKNLVKEKYHLMRSLLPAAELFYAVKANPAPEILSLLHQQGACFDAASVAEIKMCLEQGVSPDKISYGNTIKKEVDIAWAYKNGIRLFAFDSQQELDKLVRAAPGSKLFGRLLYESKRADWPLSRKFGCSAEMLIDLLQQAHQKGMLPHGISFHVGSQQRHIESWHGAIKICHDLFMKLRKKGIKLSTINLGGGFPAYYQDNEPPLAEYCTQIHKFLEQIFEGNVPKLMIEPGRAMVGDAGIIKTEVILVAQKTISPSIPWVFLDIGKFGGLIETTDEAISYQFQAITAKPSSKKIPFILAGPTCDSADVLYEKKPVLLPDSLAVGDHLLIMSTGAYTTTYASIAFNGFTPLHSYVI